MRTSNADAAKLEEATSQIVLDLSQHTSALGGCGGRRAIPSIGSHAPRRRHGPRQDDAGHCGVARSLRRKEGPTRSRDRPLRQEEFLRLMQLLLKQRVISNGLGQLHFEGYGRLPDAALLDGLFSPKLLELRRLVHDLPVDQGRKVVVFSQWRRMLRLAEWSFRDVLVDAGLTSAFFTGGESSKARTRNLSIFTTTRASPSCSSRTREASG